MEHLTDSLIFSGIVDDFLQFRATKQNDLRTITLHLAIMEHQNENKRNEKSNDNLFRDVQKIIDQKVFSFFKMNS